MLGRGGERDGKGEKCGLVLISRGCFLLYVCYW